MQISFAYRRTVRQHSKYVQRKQGKIKGAARRALKALSAHGFSHPIPEIHDALLEIALLMPMRKACDTFAAVRPATPRDSP